MIFNKKILAEGNNFIVVAPSRRKFKKYDVYINNKYLLSFGDIRYKHFYDKIGYYSYLDHLDVKRRALYQKRHNKTNINDPYSPAYWSWYYLW